MLNKYLQAGIGLAAALLTTPFLAQSAQAQAFANTDVISFEPVTVTNTNININNGFIGFLCPSPPSEGEGGTLICEEDLIPIDNLYEVTIYEQELGDFTCATSEVLCSSGIGNYTCGTLAVPGCVINTSGVAPTAVPEPLTLLGASAAIAFGAGFKRRKKQG